MCVLITFPPWNLSLSLEPLNEIERPSSSDLVRWRQIAARRKKYPDANAFDAVLRNHHHRLFLSLAHFRVCTQSFSGGACQCAYIRTHVKRNDASFLLLSCENWRTPVAASLSLSHTSTHSKSRQIYPRNSAWSANIVSPEMMPHFSLEKKKNLNLNHNRPFFSVFEVSNTYRCQICLGGRRTEILISSDLCVRTRMTHRSGRSIDRSMGGVINCVSLAQV